MGAPVGLRSNSAQADHATVGWWTVTAAEAETGPLPEVESDDPLVTVSEVQIRIELRDEDGNPLAAFTGVLEREW